MGLARRLVIILWLGTVGLIVVYPPHYQTNGGTVVGRGHTSLLNPQLVHGSRRHSSRVHLDWLVLVVEMLVVTGLAVTFFYRFKTRSLGRCAACGYDLRATPQVCPECGERAEVPEKNVVKVDATPGGAGG
ncbi:MAG: hypothetical protein AAF823_00670 [Planctomycetota bacterium]